MKQTITSFETVRFAEAACRQFDRVPHMGERADFSPAYRQAVDQMLAGLEAAPAKSPRPLRLLRPLLIAALVVLLLTGTVFAVPALREGLVGLFLHNTGPAYVFEISPEDRERAPRTIETAYAPGYLPEGYKLVRADYDDINVRQTYQNAEQLEINYSQNVLYYAAAVEVDGMDGEFSGVHINSENSRAERVIVNGYEVIMVVNEAMQPCLPTVYLWTDQNYLYELNVDDTRMFDLLELEKVIDSMHEVPLTKNE